MSSQIRRTQGSYVEEMRSFNCFFFGRDLIV